MTTTAPPQRELVDFGAQLGANETDAFTNLYTQLARPLHDYLSGVTRDRVVAEDLLQETFLRAWAARHTFRESAPIRPWMYSIATNLAFRYLKGRRADLPIDEYADQVASERTAEDAAISGETTQLVWTAAGSLDPHHRAVLDLSLRHGFSAAEIGEILAISPSRAKDLSVRSREALGTAVRSLLVVRQRAACENLQRLVPDGVKELSPEQRASVNQHMRRCDECRSLAQRLTQPAELFGAILLLTLPETARHFKAMTINTASTATNAFDAAPNTGSRGLDVFGPLRAHRMATALAIGSLTLGATGGAFAVHQQTQALPHGGVAAVQVAANTPPPSPTAMATAMIPSTPDEYWAAALTTLRNASSYHVSYTGASLSDVFTTFDITVGPNGDWYGTVTNAVNSHAPFTVERYDGTYYVQGGPNVVATADMFALTPTQAQNLGTRWIALNTLEPNLAALIDRDIAPYANGNSLATMVAPQSPPLSAGTGISNGQSVITLSAGTATMTVTTGAHAVPLSITDGAATLTLSQVSQPVIIPQLIPLATKNQLG